MVSALGRGIEALETALKNGPVEPSLIEVPFQEDLFPVYSVAKETLKDPILRGARRADRFSKMAVLAASDAVENSGVELSNPERVGVIIGTAFGPHPTVFSFLNDILEFGDTGVSPTLFSHSVHNAAASYVSVALRLAGPAMTLTTFTDPFQQSLILAQTWLDQGICDSVLVGGVEECGTVMEYIVSQKLRIADRQMKPFFFDGGPSVIPGEGAVFFLLGREPAGPYSVQLSTKPEPTPDLWITDFECPELPVSAPAGCWSYLAGSMPISTAFSCATGALMIQKKAVYSQTSLLEANAGEPERIGCIGNHKSPIYLRRR